MDAQSVENEDVSAKERVPPGLRTILVSKSSRQKQNWLVIMSFILISRYGEKRKIIKKPECVYIMTKSTFPDNEQSDNY